MLSQVLAQADGVVQAATPEEASACFYRAASAAGASYMQTRLYRRPEGILTSPRHYSAGGFVARMAPGGWPHSAAFDYVCFECNPLLGAIRESRTRYRFSDFAPRGDRRYGTYWEAMSEAGIADALCATSYGAGGAIASLHLGFAYTDLPDDEALSVQMAGLILTEKLIAFSPYVPQRSPLTARERDALAFVAEGKTDWEISVILDISEATARFHVDNARRKLGAVTRAQAVAQLVARRLI